MAEFPDDALDFAKDLERLGIRYEPVDTIAGTIGYSTSHVSNLLGGGKPYAPGARAKIGEMIANGPAEVETVDVAFMEAPHPRRSVQGQGDLQPGPILTPTNEQSGWSEPADLPPASDYAVIDATDGTAVLVEILARFNNHTAARKICQKLNGENG